MAQIQNAALDALLTRVSDALRRLPGASELYLYGSAADLRRKDGYSDLDLQVVCTPYALARAVWPWMLRAVAPLALAYELREAEGESAYCLSFAGESLYHKVDLGICNGGGTFFPSIEHKVLLWRQEAAPEAAAADPGEVFAPRPGTPEYFLVGELLSAVRYVKARKRGQILTAWRFASAKVNALLRLLRWDGAPVAIPDVLATWDYRALDETLSAAERTALLSGVRVESPDAMDRTMIHLTRCIAARILPDGLAAPTPCARLTCEYLRFLEEELGG